MGMLVLKSRNNYLSEGTQADRERNGFYVPHFDPNILKARFFENEKQMLKWLQDETNYQPWRLDREHTSWALVPYAPEAAAIINKLIERMA